MLYPAENLRVSCFALFRVAEIFAPRGENFRNSEHSESWAPVVCQSIAIHAANSSQVTQSIRCPLFHLSVEGYAINSSRDAF